MNFRIADTFTDSLTRLTGDEQKAVKTTAFDLQMDPASPGMQFHKLDKARDKNFWSVRVSSDIRLIVHRTPGSLLLAYVGHHDVAYSWAERRRLEIHPNTGAAQWVEVRERVENVVVPQYVQAPAVASEPGPVLSSVSIDDLLTCGVPLDMTLQVRVANEDQLLALSDRLPAEAMEALMDLATGVVPQALRVDATVERRARAAMVAETASAYAVESAIPPTQAEMFDVAFEHPDAQRRFRVIENVEALERALDFPWEKWTVFLHPAQRESVQRSWGGPARVSGSAGTGKTIVALHRAVFLARMNPGARVLLTTFSETLANALRTKLRRLIGNEPKLAERLEVHGIDAVARRLYERSVGKKRVAASVDLRGLIERAAKDRAVTASTAFLVAEWNDVVDAWQVDSWEAYRDVARLGRKRRLPEKQREVLWAVFEDVRAALADAGMVTPAGVLTGVTRRLVEGMRPPFEFAVVDESQDLNVPQLRFLAALGGGRPDGLFFAGDLGQRIFQQPFSWRTAGVDIRGRARTLRINYRTSHQIRAHADRLLGPEVTDVDGNTEDRRGALSVFNGPPPDIRVFESEDDEKAGVKAWFSARLAEGFLAHELAVFVRSDAEVTRARLAVEAVGLPMRVLDESVETASGFVSISTMHLAKGLEFRAVAVMACDDEVIPLQERIESVSEDSDLQEVYNTERHLLYVACTRARDRLLVSGVKPASEFLDDLGMRGPGI